MTERSIQHGSFTIERVFDAPLKLVFGAWATPEGKARWFVGPKGWQQVERRLDFRVGGHEHLSGRFESGVVTRFDATYRDIVPDQRIIYVYDMRLTDRHISVSLATITFAPVGDRTRLVVTEQGVFLDGYEDGGSREKGTGGLLDQLAASLKR